MNRSLKQLGGSAQSARRHFLRGFVAFAVMLGLLPGGLSVALLADGAQKSTKDASSAPTLAQGDTFKEPMAFFHIPRTGGTSIEEAALKKHVTWGSKLDVLQGVTKMPDGNDCSTYHVPLDMLENLDSDAAIAYANKTRFCVTRDPAERAVSEYTSLLNQPWGSDYDTNQLIRLRHFPECTKKGLNYFLRSTLKILKKGARYIDDCHHLPQVDYIRDGRGGQMCDYIIRAENLTDSFNDLMEQLGRTIRLSQYTDLHNTSSRCPDISVQDLSVDTVALLTEVYADDYRLLNYPLPSGGHQARHRLDMRMWRRRLHLIK